jgi:hypothetical protein
MSSGPLSLAINNIKDFHGSIRGTRRESLSVVIQLSIMLLLESFDQSLRVQETSETHNHIIVGRLDGDRIGGCRGRLDISARQGWADLD